MKTPVKEHFEVNQIAKLPTVNRRTSLKTIAGSLMVGSPLSFRNAFAAEAQSHPRVARSSKGVAATVHPLATKAAIDAMKTGGNAIDAAVAASFVLSVVDGHNSGIGGGCFAMVRRSDGSIHAIDGRETAPRLATPQQFFVGGKADPTQTRTGPKAVGTPGHVSALSHLLQRFGKQSWQTTLEPSIRIAREGFRVDSYWAMKLKRVASVLKKSPAARKIYFHDDGTALAAGDHLVQTDLGNTLSAISREGERWMYEGAFAESVDRWMQQHGGLLRKSDFENYQAIRRTPILSRYRNHSVYLFPPPSSGGIHIAQMLAMLEPYDLASLHREKPADFYHLLLEMMRLVMADRAQYLGDADFVDVPRGLVDLDYLAERSSAFRFDRVMDRVAPGSPSNQDAWPKATNPVPVEKHTTHLTTADAMGNVVALTQTINTTYGAKVMVPGTGVVLNNEMDDFAIAANVANSFGLLGSDANLIAPGKRPLSSMSPTIAVEDETGSVFTCGAAGGPKILTSVLQFLVRHIDLQQSLEETIAAPRVHHQWQPEKSVCENRLDASVVTELSKKGHNVATIQSASTAQAIHSKAGNLTAVSDPRVPSHAKGIESQK